MGNPLMVTDLERQLELERRLQSIWEQGVPEDATVEAVFGPLESWVFQLGSHNLHPAQPMRPLSLASIFAAVCSFSVGMATALKGGADARLSAEGVAVMVAGASESCVPMFVAFAFLAVAWLLVALGLRRQVAR